jgi:hypothetical protein
VLTALNLARELVLLREHIAAQGAQRPRTSSAAPPADPKLAALIDLVENAVGKGQST